MLGTWVGHPQLSVTKPEICEGEWDRSGREGPTQKLKSACRDGNLKRRCPRPFNAPSTAPGSPHRSQRLDPEQDPRGRTPAKVLGAPPQPLGTQTLSQDRWWLAPATPKAHGNSQVSVPATLCAAWAPGKVPALQSPGGRRTLHVHGRVNCAFKGQIIQFLHKAEPFLTFGTIYISCAWRLAVKKKNQWKFTVSSPQRQC